MPTTTTTTIPPTFRGKLTNWLLSLGNQSQLKLVDTTAGNYAEALPPAGLNGSTGQSSQNQELIYKKVSADGHTFTLNGASDGPLTLTAQNAFLRVKSNGTSWYKVG